MCCAAELKDKFTQILLQFVVCGTDFKILILTKNNVSAQPGQITVVQILLMY